MDRELFVQNVKKYCELAGIKPTVACRECKVGTSFINNIERRNQTPSVEKVQMLAQYLGVTTSTLLGEEKADRLQFEDGQLEKLVQVFGIMNEEGRAKILSYAEDLASSGNYKKVGSFRVGKTELA